MTDDQIKQNAKAYAVIETACNSCQRYCERGFIAGAHSRDEEIEELNNQLEARRESLFQCTRRITELEMENNKLRNPWISVEERRPDYPESEYDIDNMYLVCREGGSLAFPAIFRRNGKWYIYDHMQTTEIITPDYWMPMPKLNKEN